MCEYNLWPILEIFGGKKMCIIFQ